MGLDRVTLGAFPFFPVLRADHVRGPVAASAHGVEGEVGRALVDPAGDALSGGPARAHDELAARVRVREHAHVQALGLAVREDLDLKGEDKV